MVCGGRFCGLVCGVLSLQLIKLCSICLTKRVTTKPYITNLWNLWKHSVFEFVTPSQF